MKLVVVTVPEKVQERFCEVLLSEKLVACANVVRGVRSRYWWRGKLESADEAIVLMKTADELLETLTARIRSLHPYELPEIVAYAPSDVPSAYESWVRESTTGSHRPTVAGTVAEDLADSPAEPGPSVETARPAARASSARAAASLGVVLVGSPGSGKNTHARMLAARYGMEPVSARGILAKAASDQTGSWIDVRKMMAEGKLVPDEKIEELIAARLRGAPGYLLDGFPRTAAQAKFLDGIRRPDVVIYLSADEETLLSRLSSRLVCGSCGRSYGAEAAPKHPGICDDCGYKLSAREDDSSAAAEARLREYNEKTRPLLQHYRDVLHPVRSAGRAEDVHARICAIIEERITKKASDSARGASPPRKG